MTRDYLIKKVNNRIDLNQVAINECTGTDSMRLVISNNNDLLRLIKTELEKQPDKTYEQGMHDIWGLWQKVHCEVGFNANLLEHIFGYEYLDTILERLSPGAALEKFKAYEQKKREEAEKPVVGDVVDVCRKQNGKLATGLYTGEDDIAYSILVDGTTLDHFYKDRIYLKKTGKHVDLEGLFE